MSLPPAADRLVADVQPRETQVSTATTRVAFCITELDPGGAERMMVELVCRLDRDRWDPLVVCLGPAGALVEPLEEAGVPVCCLGARRTWNLGVVSRLKSELRRFSPDLLQTWLSHANIVGSLAGRWAGVKSIATAIRVAERRRGLGIGCRLRLESFCGRWAGRHICVSEEVAEFSRSVAGLAESKLVVIPNGVDVEKFDNAPAADLAGLGIGDDESVVACIGRLDPQKDPEGALAAFADVAAVRPGMHLVFAGDGPLRERLAEQVGRAGLDTRVHLLGWYDDVPGLLARSTTLLLASRWEGMPNVVLESLAASRPVVTRPVEGVGLLVVPGRTGLVADADDPASLGAALAALLADPAKAAAMGGAGRQLVATEFSLKTMVAAYGRAWSELLS